MSELQIILYQDGACSDFMPALTAIRQISIPFDLAVLGTRTTGETVAAQCENIGATTVRLEHYQLDKGETWPHFANKIINDTQEKGYTFLLANTVEVKHDTISECISALKCNNDLCGVNPVLIDAMTNNVAHLGTVIDSVYNLHYLYEGISPNNPLAQKMRYFQLAHPAAVLFRNSVFRSVSGFKPQLDCLFFLDFCIALAHKYGYCFATVPKALAIWHRQPDDMLPYGTWNSYAALGKIPVGIVETDFIKHAVVDKQEYIISDWLWEDIANNNNLWAAEDPWLAWRHNHDPLALMRWLSGFNANGIADVIRIIQGCPAFLPKQLHYYEVLAQRLMVFAKGHSLENMQASIAIWQKKIHLFRYRQLFPAMRTLLRAGIYNASLDCCAASYDAWLELYVCPKSPCVNNGMDWPKIAIAMPVYNPAPLFLREAIRSVQCQTYANWQLCIADDASTNPEIRAILTEFAKTDKRIKIDFREKNGHICAATNSAIAMANAPFIAFMDHDDMLAPEALAAVAQAIVQDGKLALVYTDSDHIDANNIRRCPYFKANYNAEMHGSYHLSVYAADILHKTGLFRQGTEGSQDQDIFLRVTELCDPSQIRHIPRVLYHWRVHADSVSGSIQAKPYVLAATRKLKNDMACRRSLKARVVEIGVNHSFTFCYEPRPDISCALVVLQETDSIDDNLLKCLKVVDEHCKCSRYILPLGAERQFTNLADYPQFQSISCNCPTWVDACNVVLYSSTEDIILFVSSALRPLPGCKPEQLALLAALPQKGLIGSLIWQDNLLVNGGYYPNVDGIPFALLKGVAKTDLPNCCYGEFSMPREVIGMDWRAFAVPRQTLLASGGFDARLGVLANVDACLRLAEKGFSNIVSPFGQWETVEKSTKQFSNEDDARIIFIERWQKTVATNGLRNPNLEAASNNGWRLRFSESACV